MSSSVITRSYAFVTWKAGLNPVFPPIFIRIVVLGEKARRCGHLDELLKHRAYSGADCALIALDYV